MKKKETNLEQKTTHYGTFSISPQRQGAWRFISKEEITKLEKQGRLIKKEAIIETWRTEEHDPVREFGGRVPLGLGLGESAY